MSELRENMVHLGGTRYLVWTQAGFTKARKHVLGDDAGYYEHRNGYPQSYPSVVTFEEGYEGYSFYDARCTPLGQEIDQLKRMAARLEQLDADHALPKTLAPQAPDQQAGELGICQERAGCPECKGHSGYAEYDRAYPGSAKLLVCSRCDGAKDLPKHDGP